MQPAFPRLSLPPAYLHHFPWAPLHLCLQTPRDLLPQSVLGGGQGWSEEGHLGALTCEKVAENETIFATRATIHVSPGAPRASPHHRLPHPDNAGRNERGAPAGRSPGMGSAALHLSYPHGSFRVRVRTFPLFQSTSLVSPFSRCSYSSLLSASCLPLGTGPARGPVCWHLEDSGCSGPFPSSWQKNILLHVSI